jgi:hypothetical protein
MLVLTEINEEYQCGFSKSMTVKSVKMPVEIMGNKRRFAR